jgi:uncharacterized membrane protein YphA (DoxX/SURF4 family)
LTPTPAPGPPVVRALDRAAAGSGGWNRLDPRAWDRRLVSPAPLIRLTLMRVLLASVIGLRLLLRRWWEMADRPDELFRPVPILDWLSAMPPTATIVVLWASGLGATLVVLAVSVPVLRGRGSPTGGSLAGPAFVASWLALLVLAGLWGSSGKILHNDLLLLTVCAPLLFAASPRRGTASDDRDARWGWPSRAALAVLATVYFLTGVQKLRHSGPDWVFSSNMTWVIRQGNPRIGEGLSRSLADQLWLTQALAGGALLLELVAPLLLLLRRARPLFAVGAAVMHLSIWALLGLDYYGWVLTVWAVVVPMSVVGDRLLARLTGDRAVGGSVAFVDDEQAGPVSRSAADR